MSNSQQEIEDLREEIRNLKWDFIHVLERAMEDRKELVLLRKYIAEVSVQNQIILEAIIKAGKED